ncbi:hypothetical protein JCM11491_002420 [Sporobolomyces phaffii]
MRRIVCTWTEAAVIPKDTGSSLVGYLSAPLAARLAANREDIARLNHEASVLAKILRLTPGELAMFHLEASRQLREEEKRSTGRRSTPNQKRSRASDDYHDSLESGGHNGREAKLPRRSDDRTSPRPSHHLPNCSPVRYPARPSSPTVVARSRPYLRHDLELPAVRLRSSVSGKSTTATSPLRVAAGSRSAPAASGPSSASSCSYQVNGPPSPRQARHSYSALPPLKIPSPLFVPLRAPVPVPPRPASTSNSVCPAPRRQHHFSLPTPVYSSVTPRSASSFPLSSTSSRSKLWPLFPPYEPKTTSPRVQACTPVSAVRDEKPKIEKEEEDDDDDIIIVKFDPRPSSKLSEAKESHKEASPPRNVAPTLKNLLND